MPVKGQQAVPSINGSWSKRAALCVAVFCSVFARQVVGAEWSVEPIWKLESEFNTNRRLTTRPHQGVFGVITDVGADFGMATEVTKFSLKPVGTFSRYTGNENLDSNELHVDLDTSHQLERATFGMETSYAQESTLTAELEDTGLVQVQKEVDTVSANPSVTYQFNERNSLNVEYAYTDRMFQDSGKNGLFDYTYHVVDSTYTYALSEKSQLFGYLAYSRFEVPDLLSTTDSYYARAGYYRVFDENWRLTASGGGVMSESQFPVVGIVNNGGILSLVRRDINVSANGWLADVKLEKICEKGSWTAEYSRSVNPSARGAQTQRDDYSLNFNHSFTDVLSGKVGLRYFTDQTQQAGGFGAGALNRDFVRADLQISYRLNEFWTLRSGYQYTFQKYQTNKTGVDANSITFNLIYSGDKLVKTR